MSWIYNFPANVNVNFGYEQSDKILKEIYNLKTSYTNILNDEVTHITTNILNDEVTYTTTNEMVERLEDLAYWAMRIIHESEIYLRGLEERAKLFNEFLTLDTIKEQVVNDNKKNYKKDI